MEPKADNVMVLTQPKISEVHDHIFKEFFNDPPGERTHALNALLDDIANRDVEIGVAAKFLVFGQEGYRAKRKTRMSAETQACIRSAPPSSKANKGATQIELEELRGQIYEEIMCKDPDEERRNDLVVLFIAIKNQCQEISKADKYLCSKSGGIDPKKRVDSLIKYQKARARQGK